MNASVLMKSLDWPHWEEAKVGDIYYYSTGIHKAIVGHKVTFSDQAASRGQVIKKIEGHFCYTLEQSTVSVSQ